MRYCLWSTRWIELRYVLIKEEDSPKRTDPNKFIEYFDNLRGWNGEDII